MSSNKRRGGKGRRNRLTLDALLSLRIRERRKHSAAVGSEMYRNLVAICDTLRKKSKHVCLATIASACPLDTEMDDAGSAVNMALEQFCKRYDKFGCSELALEHVTNEQLGRERQHIDGSGTRCSGASTRYVCVSSRERAFVRQVSLQLAGADVVQRL